MICAKCGREIVDTSRFCIYCGGLTELWPAEPAEEAVPAEIAAPAEEAASAEVAAPAKEAAPAEVAALIGEATQAEATTTPADSNASPSPAGVYAPQKNPYGSPTPMQPGAYQGQPTTPPPPSSPYGAPNAQQQVSFGAAPYSAGTSGMGSFPPPPAHQTPVQPRYGVIPQPQQSQQAPKKKVGLIVGILVGVVLFLCIVGTVVSCVVYGTIENVASIISGNSDSGNSNSGNSGGEAIIGSDDSDGKDGSGVDSSGKPVPHSFDGPVLIDGKTCTITITSRAIYNRDMDWIRVCIDVENKSDKDIFISFDWNSISADGFEDSMGYGVIVLPDDFSGIHFPAHKTTRGIICFTKAPSSGVVSNFKGNIVISDGKTFDLLEKCLFSIKKLD